MSEVLLRLACSEQDYKTFEQLSRAYAGWLGESLCFQGFHDEMNSLPGCYAQPKGCIVLAALQSSDGSGLQDVGCVALRPFDAGKSIPDGEEGTLCEVKRLYTLPAAQGSGVGRKLMSRVLEEAKAAGYRTVLLDTLERLSAANRLYENLGFIRRDPYYSNPLPNVVYWERAL